MFWPGTHGFRRFWVRRWFGFLACPMMSGALMQIKYSQDHQYVIVEDGVGTVGITNYAQEKLNEVTTVEFPHVGAQVQKGGAVCVVEFVKAASDIYSPVSGEILGVNESTVRQARACQ